MPTYNRAWALENTVSKIIEQKNCPDWECIIVDDGSDDTTQELIQKIQEKNNKIQYIFQKNAGPATARQHGLSFAQGEWIVYVDSDDALFPDFLNKVCTFFTEHPAVYFGMVNMEREIVLHDSNHQILATKKEPATEKNPNQIMLRDYAHWNIKPCGTGIFHRRNYITPEINWDPSFRLLEDIDFLLQFGAIYPDNFGFIPEKLFYQGQIFGCGGVCSGASYEDWADYFEKLYRKHENSPLMNGQEWYPTKVNNYRIKQKQFEAGLLPAPAHRHFPEYFN